MSVLECSDVMCVCPTLFIMTLCELTWTIALIRILSMGILQEQRVSQVTIPAAEGIFDLGIEQNLLHSK